MKFLAPLGMLALCGFLLVFGSQQLVERQARLAEMAQTTATVTLAETRKSRPTSRNSFGWAEVTFADASGAQIEAGYNFGLPFLGPAEGDVVSIFYDPANPLDIESGEFVTMWSGYVIAALVILLFSWMGIGLLVQNIRSLFGRASA